MLHLGKSKFLLVFGLLAGLVLTGCEDAQTQATNPDYDFKATTTLARQKLADLQAKSIRENREYCGYIGLDSTQTLRTTLVARGGATFCEPTVPPSDWVLVASFHTHGAYDPLAYSEVPSSNDIEGDHQEGVNGYVATPGGRFWFIDGQAQTARQLCGVGCLRQDPRYQSDRFVHSSYTLAEILGREQE